MADYKSRRIAMVDTQIRPSDVTKFPIIEAMLSVPRESFVPRNRRSAAYIGENLAFDEARVVLEPRTLAKMLDALDIRPDELVLDVGAGYGYSSAVIARMAEMVIALEDDQTRVEDAQTALSENNSDNVLMQMGSLDEGAPEHGPFDVLILQGGVETFPQKLLNQLKDGGRAAAIFMNGALGDVRIGHKRQGQMSWRSEFNAGAPVLPGFEKTRSFAL